MSTRKMDSYESNNISGIAFSQGQLWKDNRRLFVSTLASMGMGNKNVMETIIEEEVADFCAILKTRVVTSKSKNVEVT